MQFIRDRFIELQAESSQEELDLHFVTSCSNKDITLDDVEFMVYNGANPRSHDDLAFIHSCASTDINIPLFFINNCGADIHSQNDKAVRYALLYVRNEICKMLVDNGVIISDEVIKSIVATLQYDSFQLLLDVGINPERIAKIFFDYNFNKTHSEELFMMLKLLFDFGINFNQIIAERIDA